tara:strand:+ start:464 stop:664 length:201 start_codon:yes stop_codon:yes gene_type:complete
MIVNLKHLSEVKLKYFEHLRFTWFESMRGMLIMIALLIHGICPFIFCNMFSSYIKGALNRIRKLGI